MSVSHNRQIGLNDYYFHVCIISDSRAYYKVLPTKVFCSWALVGWISEISISKALTIDIAWVMSLMQHFTMLSGFGVGTCKYYMEQTWNFFLTFQKIFYAFLFRGETVLICSILLKWIFENAKFRLFSQLFGQFVCENLKNKLLIKRSTIIDLYKTNMASIAFFSYKRTFPFFDYQRKFVNFYQPMT